MKSIKEEIEELLKTEEASRLDLLQRALRIPPRSSLREALRIGITARRALEESSKT